MKVPYYHVDAFTADLFGGNPAGVCVVPTFPADATMQRIAAENRHSQTAFVVARDDGEFDLRWFTPVVEDDLCGHATLAAAYVLGIRGHQTWPVRFHTRSGVLTVWRDDARLEMELPAWPPAPCVIPPDLLPALGLTAAIVLKARDYLVVTEHAETVRALTPDIAALARIETGLGGVIVTAPGGSDVDYVVRFFAPSVGITEDPATGSIHCTLAPYWSSRLGKPVLTARQLSARRGSMRCTVTGGGVRIAGEARLYLTGTLHLAATAGERFDP